VFANDPRFPILAATGGTTRTLGPFVGIYEDSPDVEPVPELDGLTLLA
jgi:hypothetical protein